MSGYMKKEAEIKPAQHIVIIVNGMVASRVKELFACVPDMTGLKACNFNDDGGVTFTFEEDSARYKLEYKLEYQV
ncbi:MAG: hypothetical protein Q8P12_02590 [bacterium]|nr:hypothetical protein [bacterium]